MKLVQRKRELGQLALRAFASGSKEVAPTDSNNFLRFSNPYPQDLDYTPLLSSIPETKVCIDQYLSTHSANAPEWQEACTNGVSKCSDLGYRPPQWHARRYRGHSLRGDNNSGRVDQLWQPL